MLLYLVLFLQLNNKLIRENNSTLSLRKYLLGLPFLLTTPS